MTCFNVLQVIVWVWDLIISIISQLFSNKKIIKDNGMYLPSSGK